MTTPSWIRQPRLWAGAALVASGLTGGAILGTTLTAGAATTSSTTPAASSPSATTPPGAPNGAPGHQAPPPGGGQLQDSGTYAHTFTQPGSYTYHCTVHPNMTGTVVVTA